MIGSVVLATDQGLGYLAKSFYDHGIIDKVYIQPHSSRPSHKDWYKEEDIVARPEDLLDCDALLFIETPFHWKLIVQAREKGIPTTLIPMYECTPYPLPYEPDNIIVSSGLDLKYYERGVFIPIPVEVPWRLRKKAKVFVHNAGNLGIGGRNGTKEVVEAMQYVESPVQLLLRSQVPLNLPYKKNISVKIGKNARIHISEGHQVPSELFYGDVFLFPEKFNGLSLPLQEAYASGMLVMAGDRFPMNAWLPKEPLIPVSHYTKERIAVEFQCAQYNPKTIAKTMDEWFGKDIKDFSLKGKEWAESVSWSKLKPHYLKIIHGV